MEGSRFAIIVMITDADEERALVNLAAQHNINCAINNGRIFFFIPTTTMLVLMSQYISELLE